MIRHLPNLLCILRILMSLSLLFLAPLCMGFLIVYVLCGVSDWLDGFLARALRVESVLGGRLDSLADLVLVCVVLWTLLPVWQPGAAVLCWIGGIAILRLLAAVVARRRFGVCGFLHTIGNKLTGALLFLYPLVFQLLPGQGMLYALCAVATLTAVEELLIELTAKRWDPDRKSFFSIRKTDEVMDHERI